MLLETIAGRYRLKGGSIEMAGDEISTLLPERRNIGFVYQNYELFPHMTVEQNIAFRPEVQGSEQARQKRQDAADDGDPLFGACPRQLFRHAERGEKQRTAIGRALVISPKLLLLDEPMSALDYVTKQNVKNTIKQVHRQFSSTVIHVTHDIEEALFFADRIGIIKDNTMPLIFGSDDIRKMRKGDFYAYL